MEQQYRHAHCRADAFHSGAEAISDIPLSRLAGPGVVVDISDTVSNYSLTPEMITSRADVRKGDILIINTGYHRHTFDQPDTPDANAQGGIENKELALLRAASGAFGRIFPVGARHGIESDRRRLRFGRTSDEHTNIRYQHAREFDKSQRQIADNKWPCMG